MPRLKIVDPATAEGKVKELFDGPLKLKKINIYKTLANSPAALDALTQMGDCLAEGVLSAKEREVIALAIGENTGCEYCVAAHTVVGKMAGMSIEETIAARRGKLNDPKLNALATFVLALHEKRGWMSDEDVAAFRDAGYGDAHIGEVIAVYALNILTNYINHVNQTEIDFPEPPPLD